MAKSEIEELLPHRDPFLFVDKLTKADDEGVIGERTFREEDFFFPGHFPGHPIVPGVILVESMAQCGGAGLRQSGILKEGELFFLATIKNAKFREPVKPNDTIRFEIVNERVSGRMIKQSGVGYLGDKEVMQASWMCIRAASDSS